MSLLKEYLRLARDAIRYVDQLGLTSINVPFRLSSYVQSPLSDFDVFLFWVMRADSDAASPSPSMSIKQIRHDVLAVIRNAGLSKHHKKSQILQIMKSAMLKPDTLRRRQGQSSTPRSRLRCPDELRIRCVRKAIKYGHGNCGEKAAIAATWLNEQRLHPKQIAWVAANTWDHSWTVLGAGTGTVFDSKIATWNDSAVVVDGWTSDYYQAKHPYSLTNGNPVPNPFQLYVRRKLQQVSGNVDVIEVVQWPPKFSPTFALKKAALPNKAYEVQPPVPKHAHAATPNQNVVVLQCVDVADDPEDLVDDIVDLQEVSL